MSETEAPQSTGKLGKKPHELLHVVVLSPHRDDAAFSLALSIGAWLRDGHSVTIVNVFTRSLYAPYSDAESVHENDRLSYVSAMRKREDEDFLKHIPGAVMIDLNIKDAPLRLHCDASIVCDMPVDPADGAFAKIHKALLKHTSKPNTALVLPLALGHHVDHRVARDATLPLSENLPCAFYEDLPYATRDGVSIDLQRFREDVDAKYHEHLYPVVCYHSSTIAWKRQVALGYTSQIREDIADLVSNFAHRYHGNERLWANEAFIALAKADHLGKPETHPEPLPA
jgi:hypothetical protein